MKTLLICLTCMAFILFQGNVYAQKLLRTEAGMVDLMEDDSQQQNPYEDSLESFRLAGSNSSRTRTSPLSLGNYGEPSSFRREGANYFSNAKKYIEQEDWEKAMLEINDALALDPNNPELIRIAAIASTMLQDFYMANHYYERYMDLDPGNIKYMVGWAGVLIRTFRFEKAEELLAKSQEIDPDYLPAKFYKLILDIMASETTINNASWLRLFLGDKRSVLRWIRADQQVYMGILGPKGFQRLCDLAIGTESGKNLDEIDKQIDEYYGKQGNIQLDDITNLLDRIKELGVEGLAVPMERAIQLFNNGEAQKALDIAEDLYSQYPDQAHLTFNYGYMLMETGQYNKAETLFRKSNQLIERGVTKFALASVLAITGDRDGTWKLLFQLAKEEPEKLAEWLEGTGPALKKIKSDRRYPVLCNQIGIPPESQ